jgi:drug/metabolite transporter (DMT)-like permease
MNPAPERARLYAMLGVLAVVWGTAFVGIKEVLRELSPATLTILRFAIADICLLVVLAAVPSTRPRFERRDWWRVAVLGITGVPGYHLALNWGEQRTSASVAALIVATAPVMVALGSAALLRERVTARRWLGIALAFAGVAVLAFAHRTGGTSTSIRGVLVAILAPVSWAVYTIVAKPLTQRASSLQVTATGMLVGSLALLPFVSGQTVREIGDLSAAGWAWMVQLAVGSSVLGYFLFVWALARLEATKVAVFLYAVPVVAILSAWIILHEPLGASVLVAAALVIAGVVLAQQERIEPALLEADGRG